MTPPRNPPEFATRMQRVQSSAVRDLLKHSKTPGMISLAGGIPASDLFDLEGLGAIIAGLDARSDAGIFQYSETEGERGLRAAIASLLAARGITAKPENVLVTSGSQQGLDLAARILLSPGDRIVLERPSYLAALQTFGLAEAQIVTAPSDADGMDVGWVEDTLSRQRVKAIYVVPDFGNPTGATLSLERRRRLVELAGRTGTVLLEDDPYGALRFAGAPLPSLQALAAAAGVGEQVIYLSSFSKILAPGLRIGWMVLSDAAFRQAALAKQAIDLHSCSLSQHIVAAYLASGRLGPRLQVLREGYRERRDALMGALRERLGGAIDFSEPAGGMFLWARFGPAVDSARVLAHGVEQGVVFVPGAAFYAEHPEHNTLRLSYSMITPAAAREAAERLARALAAATGE
jgi:DNA-binding transcriptional MocR family regulator